MNNELQTIQRYEDCFRRIGKAIGITSGLQITAAAENDKENSAEILTRLVEQYCEQQVSTKEIT